MTKTFSSYVVLLALLLFQRVEAQSPQTEPSPGSPAEQQSVEDPLGRSTPYGTVIGLITAVEQENLDRAAEYLESRLKPRERRELARKLGIVLDRKLFTSSTGLSNRSEGNLADGLPFRDRLGLVESPSGNVEVFLDRLQRGQGNPIWLFSADMFPQIPRLYAEVQPPWAEAYVPERLRTTRWLGIPLYRWIAIIIAIPLIFGFAALCTRALTRVLNPLFRHLTREHEDRTLGSRGPLRLLVLGVCFYGVSFFGITLASRQFWHRLAETVTVIALCWLSLRLLDVTAKLSLKRLEKVHRSGDTALVLLINRLSKAAIVIVAGLVLLYLANVDLTAALTGLGVGGLAIGFGAQKTIENLFGGIMVISDKPISVGDVCRAGEFFGTVEDIGMRSTRIRTLDRTVVAVPNGLLASMSLENFAKRDRIRFQQTVGLQHQTTADQMRSVLTEIRGLLDSHPKVDAMSSRARFIRFSGTSLDLEIFAYVLETEHPAFLAIQENLLLGIMDIIDRSGTAVAAPVPAAFLATGRPQ